MSLRASGVFWLAVALLVAFGLAQVAAEREELVGTKAPDFELESVRGGTVSIASMKGRVVLLDFWAVWCGPCESSMPYFQKLQKEYGKRGLEVVGVHVDDRMPALADVKEYLEERDISYQNLLSTVEVDDSYLVYAMPTSYLVDREGVVRKMHVGFDPRTTPEKLERDVRELLALE